MQRRLQLAGFRICASLVRDARERACLIAYEKNAIFSAWVMRRIGARGSLAARGFCSMPLARMLAPSDDEPESDAAGRRVVAAERRLEAEYGGGSGGTDTVDVVAVPVPDAPDALRMWRSATRRA